MESNQKAPAVREVASSEIKNEWHAYLDAVQQGREQVVITRYGRPVARLVPFEAEDQVAGLFGFMAGTVSIHGNIVDTTDEAWEADG